MFTFTSCANHSLHYNDVIMSEIASQITSISIVCWTIYSGADQRKYQSSAPLAFVWGIHRRPVNSPHKRPVTQKMFPFDDVHSTWCIFYLSLMFHKIDWIIHQTFQIMRWYIMFSGCALLIHLSWEKCTYCRTQEIESPLAECPTRREYNVALSIV